MVAHQTTGVFPYSPRYFKPTYCNAFQIQYLYTQLMYQHTSAMYQNSCMPTGGLGTSLKASSRLSSSGPAIS